MKGKRNPRQHSRPQVVFGLILASLSNNSGTPTIIRCLRQLDLSFLSSFPDLFLALFPVLLKSRCSEIASRSAELLGSASLISFEMNGRIALDGEIVKGLVSAVMCSNRSVLIAACNAVLDLSTTSVGQQRLVEFSAIDNLISCFIQAPKTPAVSVCLIDYEKGGETCPRIRFYEDEFVVLLLQAAITLINICTIKQMEKIPKNLSDSLLVYLKKLWARVHKQMLCGNISEYSQGRNFCESNIRTNNLAECIFRLSLNAGQCSSPPDLEEVMAGIFGYGTSFQHFILNNWEVSPFIIRRPSSALTKEGDILSYFLQSLESKETVPLFLSLLLPNFTSCLPIASDELDILHFVTEVRHIIGCPLIHDQDIRVIKTQSSKTEMHFFRKHSGSCSFQVPLFMYGDDIMKCEEAYREGYTVALQGMQFRFAYLSSLADALALLFGQPSAGANMYMTPPDSQGLARHCDDHCVFVFQLIGVKQWTIFPRLSPRLPRLYEPDDCCRDLEDRSPTMDDSEQVMLTEGDILYIPRGFHHEARSVVDNSIPNEIAGFSLHLTLAVEVEPPFEWEGFIHVALCHWNQKPTISQCTSYNSLPWDVYIMCVNLMHVAIILLGDLDPTFRKACLVGAIPLFSSSNGWLNMNQKMIFRHVIDRINSEAKFLDVLRSVETAFLRDEDSFQRIGWLQHLNIKGVMTDLGGNKHLLLVYEQYKDIAEDAFLLVKSRFCREIVFEDVQQSYELLLEKYRRARKQYMNGMVSLHCN